MISEYTAKYCWKQNPEKSYPKPKPDNYEVLIQNKINDDYQSSSSSVNQREITDPYELLVQQKLNGEYESQSQIDIPKPLDQKEEKPVQEEYVPEESQIDNFDVESEAEKVDEKEQCPQPKKSPQPQPQQSQTVRGPVKKFKATNKLPGDNRLPEERNTQYQQPQEHYQQTQPKTSRKQKSSNFLSSSVNNSIKPKVTVYRPQFFAHPETAPPEEQQNLHGPFWVYWPKDEIIPAKYAGLRSLIRKK